MNETTQFLVADASSGPGEYVARFARAKAHTGALTQAQSEMVRRFDGVRLGYVSKALVYGVRLTAKDAAMFARLVKGGMIFAERAERHEDGYVLRAAR